MKLLATIEVIPHRLQQYATVGNWHFTPRTGKLEVSVSDMGNDDYAFLVGLHELVEAWLCRKRGISDDAVTAFDKQFEAKREPGNTDEPGDDPSAPYRQEHRTATLIERILCCELGINWDDYDRAVNAL